MGTRRKLPVPRPGALAARRRVLATEYRPRYELAQGHDPWDSPDSVNSDGALSPEDVASLGLTLRPIVY